MPNNKSLGNDGLSKEFYEVFLEDLKTPLILSFKLAFDKGELSNSQKQAVIKLIEKKDKEKRLIQNLFLFLKLPLFSLKKIKILRVLTFLTIYSYILLMPMIQHFF